MTRTTKILLFNSFLGFSAMGLLGPIYAIFVQKIGGDVLDAGIAYGIFSIVSGIFVFSLGRWPLFRRNLRPAIVVGYFLFTLANAGYLIVQNSIQLFLVQIVLGISMGILEPSWDGLFSANLNEDRAARLWSTWAGTRDFATGIGALLGGVLVVAYSFHFLFLVMLVLNSIATLVSLRLLWHS